MSGTCSCCSIGDHFDYRIATRDLTKYRRSGPSASTRRLLAAIREIGIEGKTLLDVGGGIGIIAVELLSSGAAHATVVDQSAAYVAAAREESERRWFAERITIVEGNFTAMEGNNALVDVVTLDKVVCCYPDLASLRAASTARPRQLYGIVYPRDNWWVRIAVAAENAVNRPRRSSFRMFVFSNAAIDQTIQRAGLTLVKSAHDLSWVIALYERRGDQR